MGDDRVEICFDWQSAFGGRGLDVEPGRLDSGIFDAARNYSGHIKHKDVIRDFNERFTLSIGGIKAVFEMKYGQPRLKVLGLSESKVEYLLKERDVCVRGGREDMIDFASRNFVDTTIPDVFAEAWVRDSGLAGLKLTVAEKLRLSSDLRYR